jgi:hypothetical protein
MPRVPRDVNQSTSPTTVGELFEAFKAGFKARKFSAGLLIAFIDLFQHLETPKLGMKGWNDFVRRFPPLDSNRRGAANTLTVQHKGSQITLRRFYDPVETFFRAEHHRMDYPNCAPHATQAWNEARYRPWLDVLVSSSSNQLDWLRQKVVDFILQTLPDHSAFDVEEAEGPSLFATALSGFDMSAQTGERTGAPFQGLIFGFLRADNPHLQVTSSKVRSGGARHGAVGDIDCWNGARLALTAEVKHFTLSKDDVTREISDFAERVRQKGARGLVVAIDFDDEASEAIADLGLVPVSVDDLLHHVRLWDSQKHSIAVTYTAYAFLRVEMSASLAERFQAFISENSAELSSEVVTDEDAGEE